MSMKKEDHIERLTVSQMAEKYPDRWVGLINVKYKDDDGITIESADVCYLNATKDELFHEQINSGSLTAWYTTEEDFAVGMIGV